MSKAKSVLPRGLHGGESEPQAKSVLPRGLLGGESETPSCTDREKVVARFPLTRGS